MDENGGQQNKQHFTNIHLFNMKVTYNLRSRIVYERQNEVISLSPCIVLIFDTETTGLLPRQSLPFVTKYEKTRVLGERARQINAASQNCHTLNPNNVYTLRRPGLRFRRRVGSNWSAARILSGKHGLGYSKLPPALSVSYSTAHLNSESGHLGPETIKK